mgnify:CR=1 FL=1
MGRQPFSPAALLAMLALGIEPDLLQREAEFRARIEAMVATAKGRCALLGRPSSLAMYLAPNVP